MKASELIKSIVDIIVEHGDGDIAVKGRGDGSYHAIATEVKAIKRVEIWRYTDTPNEIIISID